MLPVCIHLGVKPCPSMSKPIVNEDGYSHDRDKPYGGLWTSVLDVEHGTDWLRACKEMGRHMLLRHAPKSQAWVVHPRKDVRVLCIEDGEDYDILCELYPRDTGRVCGYMDGSVKPILCVDWEKVAQDYDVVWVQDWYMGPRAWDCETILFLRWDAVERVEHHKHVSNRYERMCA